MTLVRADGIQPYWYVHIYTGLVALLDRIQSSFSSITISTGYEPSAVVGERLPPLQSHAFEWVRDWVRVIAALHHAIDKFEKPSLDGI